MSDSKKVFTSKKDAFEWMEADIDDPCVDNYRFAFADDEEANRKYEEAVDSGCCGYFDAEIVVDGRAARIGCNYGH